MTLGCLISGVGVIVSASLGYFNIKSSSSAKDYQLLKYKKLKQKIKSKYTFITNSDDYMKIACLLHLARNSIVKCSFLNVDNICLTVPLQNTALKVDSNVIVKGMYDDRDGSLWITFLDMNTRTAFETYIKYSCNIFNLLSKCKSLETKPPGPADFCAYATLNLMPPASVSVYGPSLLPPAMI